jgi:hypothetical protein
LDERQLWLRPAVSMLIASQKLDALQRAIVNAAFKRFVVGGIFTVVTKDCSYKEVAGLGDIRELKGFSPPFLEMRFKPPRHDLRLFGRCIGKDRLILASHGMKDLKGPTNEKPMSIPEHRKRCDDFFQAYQIEQRWVPPNVADSFSKAEFV